LDDDEGAALVVTLRVKFQTRYTITTLSIKETKLPIRTNFIQPIMKIFAMPFIFDDVTVMQS
jgi:hypothetical protein